MQKVVLYIRVSTNEQAQEGYSIEAQKRRLLLYAEAQDWTVINIYIDDGWSAKDLNRPEMQNLLKDAHNREFDIVLTYKLDRLTRSVSDCDRLFQDFDKLNISYQSATESFETRTATGRMFIRLIAVMAQWERENTAERVQFGVEQKILQGEHVGVFPFGYTNKGELIKEEADLIKEVRSFFLSGYGYKKIAMALNRAGKLRRSKLWSDSTVAYTVENPIYYGMVRISSRTKEGVYINWRKDDRVNCVYGDSIYPAIFTKEQHEETKREIERRYKRNGYSRKNIYWFSGTLKCGRCGASMFGRKVSAQQSYPETLYYICSNRHHKKTCDLPIIRQIHMEKLILDYLKSFAIDSELLLDESAELVKQKKAAEQRIAQLKQQIGAIRERRKKWQYMFANELISSDELRERLQEENDLLQQHEEDIKSLSIQEDDSHDIDIAKNFLSIWPKLIDEEKKELVSNMFSKIVVDTDLTNPRVSKGTFYPAYITELLFN